MAFPGQQMGPSAPMGGSMFMNSVAQGGNSSLFTGYNAMPGNPAGSFPGMGMLNMATQPMIHGFIQGQGMIPGQFMGTQNFYDQYRQEQRNQQTQQAVAQGAALDAGAGGVQQQTLINMGLVPGEGLAQQGNAAGMARFASQFTPMLAQFAPDFFDKLHGRKGSAQVLAQGLMRGGRYAIDPVTGQRELQAGKMVKDPVTGKMTMEGGSSVQVMMEALQDTVNDPASEMSQHGISMGQAGLMYETLSQRGMLGVRGAGTMTRSQQYEHLAEEEGKTPEEVRAEAQDGESGQEAFQTKLRQFDAKRVKGRIEGLSGAVDAMREIFGDMGNPNAPMSEIIEGLNQLTQGGVANMPAANLERMVRMTKAIADNSGMGIDSIMALTASAAQMGDQLGQHRSLAVVAGQRGALGGRAVADMGWAGVWGAASSDEAAAMITRTTVQGIASQSGQAVTSLFRMEQEIAGGSFAEGTRAAKLMAAIKRGDDTFEGQSLLELTSNPAAMNEILADSGLSEHEVAQYQTFMSDSAGNDQYAAENSSAVNAIEIMQMQEVGANVMGNAVQESLGQVLAQDELGLTQQQQAEIQANIGGTLTQELWEETTADDMKDEKTWLAHVSKHARPKMIEQFMQQGMSREAAEQAADAAMPAFAASVKSSGNLYAQDQGYDNMAQSIQVMGGQTLKQRNRNRIEAERDAAISGAMAPLTSRGPLRELMDVMQEGDVEWDDALAQVLGGIDGAEAQEAFKTSMNIMRDSRQQLDKITNDRSGTYRDADGTYTELGLSQQEHHLGVLEEQSEAVNTIAEGQGDSWLTTKVERKESQASAKTAAALSGATDAASGASAKDRDAAYKDAVSESSAMTNKFLGDENSMAQLGEGGLALVESLEADDLELQRLVDKHGSYAEALAAEPDAVRELVERRAETSSEIDQRMAAANAGEIEHEMTEEEKKDLEERQEAQSESFAARQDAVLKTLEDLEGGEGWTDAERERHRESLTGESLIHIERQAERQKQREQAADEKGYDSWEVMQADMDSDRKKYEALGMSEEAIDAAMDDKYGEGSEELEGGGDMFQEGGDTGDALDAAGYGEDYVADQADADQDPVVKGLLEGMENMSFEIMTLNINGDGPHDLSPENADSTA